jgi:DNA-binding transcriptional ArsR family regulator
MSLDASPDRDDGADLWRALASPWRRQLLDLLSVEPRTTGDLAARIPELSRYAVMQHLDVLVRAGVVVARRRGRHRFNHLNPVPLRTWYERWVTPLADRSSGELLALRRHVEGSLEESGDITMTADLATEQVRTVRLECELRFRSTAHRVFQALTQQSLSWFPHTYGEDRVRAVVIEPHVGGRHYEDWGDGAGHLYGHVTAYDPPNRVSLRGRIMPGTILDTEYGITEDGDEAVLRMSKVAVGPMTEEEAASIRTYGDISRFADALRRVVEAAP